MQAITNPIRPIFIMNSTPMNRRDWSSCRVRQINPAGGLVRSQVDTNKSNAKTCGIHGQSLEGSRLHGMDGSASAVS